MQEEGWLKLGHCANADSEGYIEMQSNDEDQKYGKIEARVRLELGCISQCIVIDLEGRTGAAKYNPNMVPACCTLCRRQEGGGAEPGLRVRQGRRPHRPALPRRRGLVQRGLLAPRHRGRGHGQHQAGGRRPALHPGHTGNQPDVDNSSQCIYMLQAGIDRANQGAACPSEWLERWEVKTTCLSYQSGELGAATSRVSRALFLSRYQQQIAQIFSSRSASTPVARQFRMQNIFFQWRE